MQNSSSNFLNKNLVWLSNVGVRSRTNTMRQWLVQALNLCPPAVISQVCSRNPRGGRGRYRVTLRVSLQTVSKELLAGCTVYMVTSFSLLAVMDLLDITLPIGIFTVHYQTGRALLTFPLYIITVTMLIAGCVYVYILLCKAASFSLLLLYIYGMLHSLSVVALLNCTVSPLLITGIVCICTAACHPGPEERAQVGRDYQDEMMSLITVSQTSSCMLQPARLCYSNLNATKNVLHVLILYCGVNFFQPCMQTNTYLHLD